MLYLPITKSWILSALASRVYFAARVSLVLSPDSSDNIQHQRQYNAEQNRSHQRKVKRSVLPAIKDISGQAPDREIGTAEQQHNQTGDHNHQAQEDEHLADFGHN